MAVNGHLLLNAVGVDADGFRTQMFCDAVTMKASEGSEFGVAFQSYSRGEGTGPQSWDGDMTFGKPSGCYSYAELTRTVFLQGPSCSEGLHPSSQRRGSECIPAGQSVV